MEKQLDAIRGLEPEIPVRSVVASAKNVVRSVTGVTPAARRDEAVSQALSKLLLPDDLFQLLDPPLKELGFVLDPKPGRIRDLSRQWHHHYRVPVKAGYIALLYVANRLLQNAGYSNSLAWIGFAFPSNGAKAVFIFSDSAQIAPAYDTLVSHWLKTELLEKAKFFHQGYISDLHDDDPEGRRDSIHIWFDLDSFQRAPPSRSMLRVEDLVNNHDKVEEIIAILKNQAASETAPVGAKGYMRNLINKANWPPRWRQNRVGGLTGGPEFDARELVNWAFGQGKHPNGDRYGDYTVIGGLLEVLVDDVGAEKRAFLEDIIATYHLIESYSP